MDTILALGCMISTIKAHWGLLPVANNHVEHTKRGNLKFILRQPPKFLLRH